jgi:hypothetical protein
VQHSAIVANVSVTNKRPEPQLAIVICAPQHPLNCSIPNLPNTGTLLKFHYLVSWPIVAPS